MIITDLDQVMCENRNAELLMQEVYRMNPNTKFTIFGDMITEKSALILYETISNSSVQNDKRDMIYVPLLNLA